MSDRSLEDTLAAADEFGALSMASPPPTLAGRYRLVSLLGAGGMGSVYRARDAELDEDVALKVLHKQLIDAPGMLARFRQEVKLARRVTHRNVARTFDIGEHEGEKFLTMEFVDGESLAAMLRRRGQLPVNEVLSIGKQISAGLAAAHAVGVVHRDLKPDNVLVAPDGRVVITDFGIARAHLDASATGTLGGLVGTPAYMAPEQAEALPDVDHRADIYALGEVIYEMLTGERAWPGEVMLAVVTARLMKPPPDPRARRADAPDVLADVVLACLARSRDARPPNADTVAAALETVGALGPTSIAPRSIGIPFAPPALLPSPDDRAVAVLHFKNLGPPEDDYVALGLTEDLLDALAMTRGLKVRAHSAGGASDARDIGRSLGVDVIVEGSVRRAGERLRINARLVSVADGFQLWSQRFDRGFVDLLAVNDEAVRAIATALSAQHLAPSREAPTDPVAIELYFRALQFAPDGDSEHAIALLEQALERAPRHPGILSLYAVNLGYRTFLGGPRALVDLARAREVADRALEIAPHLAEPWVALAHVRFGSDDPAGAVRAARRALRAGPSLAKAHDLAGRILLEVGALSEGVAHLERAHWLGPSVSSAQDLVRGLYFLGNLKRADKILDSLEEPIRSHVLVLITRTRMRIWQRRPFDGPAPRPTNAHPQLKNSLEVLAETLETGVMSDESTAFFAKLIAAAPPQSRPRRLYLQIQTELLAFGNRIDDAEVALSQAVENHLLDLAWLDGCPLLEPLRARPSFSALRAEVASRAAVVVEAWRAAADA